MNEQQIMELKEQICEIGHCIWQLGFVAANDGNISVKLDEDHFLCTPTGTSKRILKPEMILLVDKTGKVLDGNDKYKPSSEFKMHLRCYAERPDVGAVVHAHPPIATSFAIDHEPLDFNTMPEVIIFIGAVPIAKYGTPSTNEIPDAVAPYLQTNDAILLENHGALTVGKDLMTAYYRMETLEYHAKTAFYSSAIGCMQRLSGGDLSGLMHEIKGEQLDKCLDLRKTFSVPGKHPGKTKYDEYRKEQ